MFKIFAKDTPSAGSVLFRGNLAPRAEEFAFLQSQGVAIEKATRVPADVHWELIARHGEWGEARIVCLKAARVPTDLLRFTPGLTKQERQDAAGSGVTVSVKLPAKSKTVLRDRKRLLRYLRAIMSDDGILSIDHQSQQGWGRQRLDDELMHDADLDIEALYSVHFVTDDVGKEEPTCTWLHTHGLMELGAFDFDVLRPHADLGDIRGADALRALAFQILGGEASPDHPRLAIGHPNMEVRLVNAEAFMRQASPADRALRDDPDNTHARGRSVVCDPSARSFLGLGRPKTVPCRWMTKPLPDHGAFHFDKPATQLMALRARQTVHLVPRIIDDLRQFDPVVIAKIGYPVDGGGPDECEHMWFTVHRVDTQSLDATLDVDPFRVSHMKRGDRAQHDTDRLTDWMIALPFGMITPRSFSAWHMAKSAGPELLEIMKLMGGGPPN